MQKWEYITTDSAAELDELGEQGWELVAVIHDERRDEMAFYLKRPKKD